VSGLVSSSGEGKRSGVVAFAIAGATIIGVIAWMYLPASMRSGTFLKVAPQVLAQYGNESDEEVASRLKDLAIRSGLSMADDGVEIKRLPGNMIEARLKYWHQVDLLFFKTKADYNEVIKAQVESRLKDRKARVIMHKAEPGTKPEAKHETKKIKKSLVKERKNK